jgi:hypothetical protein
MINRLRHSTSHDGSFDPHISRRDHGQHFSRIRQKLRSSLPKAQVQGPNALDEATGPVSGCNIFQPCASIKQYQSRTSRHRRRRSRTADWKNSLLETNPSLQLCPCASQKIPRFNARGSSGPGPKSSSILNRVLRKISSTPQSEPYEPVCGEALVSPTRQLKLMHAAASH